MRSPEHQAEVSSANSEQGLRKRVGSCRVFQATQRALTAGRRSARGEVRAGPRHGADALSRASRRRRLRVRDFELGTRRGQELKGSANVSCTAHSHRSFAIASYVFCASPNRPASISTSEWHWRIHFEPTLFILVLCECFLRCGARFEVLCVQTLDELAIVNRQPFPGFKALTCTSFCSTRRASSKVCDPLLHEQGIRLCESSRPQLAS